MSEVTSQICSRSADVSAYLDGELEAGEAAFERHLRECELCSAKLNEQKQLLCALEFAFEGEKKFELPKDFAKTVAVRAEADVSGLKSREERLRAIAIAVGLFLLGVAVGVAGKRSGILPVIVEKVFTQIFIVGEVLVRFCYDIGVGAVVLLRVFGRQFISDFAASALLIAVIFLTAFVILSRLWLKLNRA